MSSPQLPAIIDQLGSAPPPPGRWTEFGRPLQVAFLEALAECGNVRAAAGSVGVSYRTAYRARRGDLAPRCVSQYKSRRDHRGLPAMKLIAATVSLALAVPVVPALAQTPAQTAAFSQFKAAMEANVVVWEDEDGDTGYDRITRHKVAGSACKPVWTQSRANRNGSKAASESYTFDFASVSDIALEFGDVSFTTADQGEIGIQSDNDEAAKRIVTAMTALKAACAG